MRAIIVPILLTMSAMASAQATNPADTVEQAKKRIRTVVIYGEDPCPPAASDEEIVVCARRPEEERYRLPPSTRDEATRSRRNDAWAARVRDMEGIGRTDKCSPVGNADLTGCTVEQIARAKAEREAAQAEAASVPGATEEP